MPPAVHATTRLAQGDDEEPIDPKRSKWEKECGWLEAVMCQDARTPRIRKCYARSTKQDARTPENNRTDAVCMHIMEKGGENLSLSFSLSPSEASRCNMHATCMRRRRPRLVRPIQWGLQGRVRTAADNILIFRRLHDWRCC